MNGDQTRLVGPGLARLRELGPDGEAQLRKAEHDVRNAMAKDPAITRGPWKIGIKVSLTRWSCKEHTFWVTFQRRTIYIDTEKRLPCIEDLVAQPEI